jgi:1-aminocyclopropane-1-carboxylate deaminase/D-cysteine desulfhydrase-like pyridoxal-dependent ACC family enzyme
VNRLPNWVSPLQKLEHLSEYLGVDLRVMRDDLFPMTGGGNKARKIVKILELAQREGCNALITNGGLQSNHARVTALAAVQMGWRCHLILHGDPEDVAQPKGNFLLMLLAGAEVEIVSPSEIGSRMTAARQTLEDEGFRPFEILGGGHSLTGALAFVDAVQELQNQCLRDEWQPQWLILASGTGTTHAGLVVGLEQLGWSTRVVGISVARKNPRGRDVVMQSYEELRSHFGLSQPSQEIDFRDEWVGEGYEKAGPDVLKAIRLAAQMQGLILDPTYTGKAFAGLLHLVGTGEIGKNSQVLFWHTGGLLNLLASHYFRDFEQTL